MPGKLQDVKANGTPKLSKPALNKTDNIYKANIDNDNIISKQKFDFLRPLKSL